jgi:hypothetical protein
MVRKMSLAFNSSVLTIIGLAIAGVGAFVTARAVIITDEQLPAPHSLIAQSRRTQIGLRLIVAGTGRSLLRLSACSRVDRDAEPVRLDAAPDILCTKPRG